ncbi:hypothetical protein J3R83DRAFT_2604, partial [Lanmaoa asiatica]
VVPQEPETTSQQADDAATDVAELDATCAKPMRPEGVSQNPQDQLTTMHAVRTPHVRRSRGEDREAAGKEVEVREVDETIRMADKEASRAETSTDETAATSTASTSVDAAARNQPSTSLAGERDSRETTDDAGADSNEPTTKSSSRVPGERPEVTGEDGDETRRPGKPTEPPDGAEEVHSMCADPAATVQVEPGGETIVQRNGCLTLESADAAVDREVVWTCRDVQDEVDRSTTRRNVSIEGERWCTRAHVRSMTGVEENRQRTSTDVVDVPDAPPEPPPPDPSPSERPARENEFPSVELEGERCRVASCDAVLTEVETDASGASRCDEDPRNRPKELWNMSERVRERSEHREEETSPRVARDELDDPGSEMAVPGSVHSIQERPTGIRIERVEATNSPCRDTPQGGHRGELGESKVVEVNSGHQQVVECAEYDGIRPRSGRNERVVETNAPRRDPRPQGHGGEEVESEVVEGNPDCQRVVEDGGYDGIGPMSVRNERVVETSALRRDVDLGGPIGEEVESGVVQDDRSRRNDGDGIHIDGRRRGKGGAPSSARSNSKRVNTKMLAGEKVNQREWYKRPKAHVPGLSKLLPKHPRSPTEHVDPPRRRGRLKSQPRRVSRARVRKLTYRLIRS